MTIGVEFHLSRGGGACKFGRVYERGGGGGGGGGPPCVWPNTRAGGSGRFASFDKLIIRPTIACANDRYNYMSA